MPKLIDLTGRRFGRLVAMYRTDDYISPTGKHTVRWHCKCDCGNETDVLRSELTTGGTLSCGCLLGKNPGSNFIDLTGQVIGRLTVLKRVPLPNPKRAIKNGWLCRCECGTEKIFTQKALSSGQTNSCGCLLRETAKRKSTADNVMGRYKGTVISMIKPSRTANKNSKTGIKGVYWCNTRGCYIAKIGIKGKTITLGRFSDIDLAAKARRAAEEEYYTPILNEYKDKD